MARIRYSHLKKIHLTNAWCQQGVVTGMIMEYGVYCMHIRGQQRMASSSLFLMVWEEWKVMLLLLWLWELLVPRLMKRFSSVQLHNSIILIYLDRFLTARFLIIIQLLLRP